MPNAAAANWEYDYWGTNVERLESRAAKYGPDNVFLLQAEHSAPAGRSWHAGISYAPRAEQATTAAPLEPMLACWGDVYPDGRRRCPATARSVRCTAQAGGAQRDGP